MNGTPVRVMVAARDVWEAADLVEDRLRRRLIHLRDRKRTQARRTGIRPAHEWRHGDLPRRLVPHYPRPAAEREVVRRKTFALEPVSAQEAAEQMELLDHDFYVFTDRRTGTDAVVYRREDGRIGLHAPPRMQRAHRAEGQFVVDGPPPVLSELAARQRLDVGGEPFVFYLDADSGRGRVMYWRYDGHYGLISAV
ncbi:sigma 54 modulation/S30EA ribosomal C-terminal domain-containing protein [Actinopolymorpha sp. B11F2]|uniref:sigma 54 modulation/S30EA ribosomal C-terminal domain-containing protein n=1 Tax=Actinopolymorpha sp. B11F2 TaxID=3160862 RepID=UPI0032E3AA05